MTSAYLIKRVKYLRSPARLADLIAAIQVLGTYKLSSRPAERWLKRLGRKPVSAETWLEIFESHPEFFTKDDQNLYRSFGGETRSETTTPLRVR
jgi:hypothetical protein